MDMSRIILFIYFMLLFGSISHAQNDRHYQGIQYGLKGNILGGAMTAGSSDNGSIYYNPAAIGIGDENGLDLSLFAPNIYTLKYKGFLNNNEELSTNSISLIPGMVTFNASPFRTDRVKIAAALLTRFDFSNESQFRNVTSTESAVNIYDFQYRNAGSEFWLSLGFAFNIAKHFSFGFTQNITFRNTDYEHHINYSTVSVSEPTNLISGSEEDLSFKFSANAGFKNKIGFTWHKENFKIGGTFTSPIYYSLIRSSSARQITNAISPDGVIHVSNFASSRPKYKSPMSGALGIEFNYRKGTVSLAGEYVGKVKKYRIFEEEIEEVLQVPGEEMLFFLEDARKGIVNVSVGVEHEFGDKASWLMGFRTDFNYSDEGLLDQNFYTYNSNFDIYHVTTGFIFDLKGSDEFAIGLDYGFSYDRKLPNLDLNFPDLAAGQQARVLYNSLTFLITYSFLENKLSGD